MLFIFASQWLNRGYDAWKNQLEIIYTEHNLNAHIINGRHEQDGLSAVAYTSNILE